MKNKLQFVSTLFGTFYIQIVCVLLSGSLHAKSLLGDYIKVIAEVSPKILQLPKSSLKHNSHHQRYHPHASDETSSDDDSDEEEEEEDDRNKRNLQSMDTMDAVFLAPLSVIEKQSLLDCVERLNESDRVHCILDHIEEYLKDVDVLYGLCEICHNLMIYNKMAMFEYKYVQLLETIMIRNLGPVSISPPLTSGKKYACGLLSDLNFKTFFNVFQRERLRS